MVEEDYLRISGFEKNFSKFVVDPLYGTIGLTSEEQRLTDSDIFRRLRRIKQLGAVSEFYNGATHTRFDHSLGTLHITWVMFKRFVDNVRNYNAWIPERTILSLFSDETIKALRITALIHDLGHGPYSHYFEGISDYLNAGVDHDKIAPFFVGDKDFQRNMKSYYAAIYLNKELKNKFLIAQRGLLSCLPTGVYFRKKILSIMNPNSCEIEDEKFNRAKNFLHDLVYGDVGSDRIDYLLRDTYATGLGHRFNLLDLLNNIAAIYDEGNNRLRFAITSEGEDVLDFFLTTRYYHYRLIANNLKNIDQFCQLRKRVEDWLGAEQNKLSKLIDLTLGDEIYFEKTVPPLDSWDFERIGSWSLGQIRADYDRFLVYRLLSGKNQKQTYLTAVQEKLRKDASKFLDLKMDLNDFRIESIVEKPRIPIISVYRQKYSETKTDPYPEEDQLSSLIHDDSEMILGLARTYLAHTMVIIYSHRECAKKVREYTSKTFSFFVDRKLFGSVLTRKFGKVDRLDIMLSALYCVLNEKKHNPIAPNSNVEVYKKSPVITSLKKLFRFLKETQHQLSAKKYEFGKDEGYNPEEKKSYEYPPEVINDLILFEYCGLIKISKANRCVNRWDPNATPKYAMSYELSFPKRAKSNFEHILKCYPDDFQQKIQKVCERGLSEK